MLMGVLVAAGLALVLGLIGLVTRRRGFGVVALLWLAYLPWEFLMYRRVLCSGECNIRVDLLLIYPVLLSATLAVLAAAAWRAIRRRLAGNGRA